MIRLAPGSYTLDNGPFHFDASVQASKVWLSGDSSASLRAAGSSMLRFSTGAPEVHIRGFELHSKVIIDGGELQIENCTFIGSSSDFGGALQVGGGALRVDATDFVGCNATRGGAIHVSDGSAIFSGCTFKGCSAVDAQGGGAVWVESKGSVTLRGKTHLLDNYAAGSRNSIHSAGGTLRYGLPAPLGHYIDTSDGGDGAFDGQATLLLRMGHTYGDYPHACLPGLYGGSDAVRDQKTAFCSGQCPAGFTCNSFATIEPTPCKMGGFCPEGSFAPQLCKGGHFGNKTGLSSADDCHVCPPGSACGVGATLPTPCTPGMFAANWSSASCSSCAEGSYQEDAGQTSCKQCDAGSKCPMGSVSPIPAACEPGTFINETLDACVGCPARSWCAGGATQPRPCSRGGFCLTNSSQPTPCEAGRYQGDAGATACKVCPFFAWCAAGSSAPTPCSSGTVGDAEGLKTQEDCLRCKPGHWCSAGKQINCSSGTYNELTGADDQSFCKPCPPNAFTQGASHTSVTDCLCDPGFFSNTGDDDLMVCSSCPQPGTTCSRPGSSLASLALALGYWRSGNKSKDPRLCPTYNNVEGKKRCTGGSEPCANLLLGIYCTSCPPAFYLDSGGACMLCSGLTSSSVSIIAVLAAALLLLLLLPLCLVRLSRCASNHMVFKRLIARFAALAEASGLAAKCKQLISFFQMASSVQSIFGVVFPPEVQAVLAAFQLFSLNLFELGLPVECMGLGSFLNRILFMMFAPLFLLACTLAIAWLLPGKADTTERGLILRALPLVLKLLFVVFPLVSAVAVQAFDCEHFDSGESWLTADFAMQCGWGGDDGLALLTAGYEEVRLAAALAILIYPLGVPLVFLLLLLACRKQLSRRAAATPLSTSLGFLSGEYKKRFFYWEVITSVKRGGRLSQHECVVARPLLTLLQLCFVR